MSLKNNHPYLRVENDKLKLNLVTLIKQLKNVDFDEKEGKHFFYGGGKIPILDSEGSEIECLENVKLIDNYLPIMKSCIVGYSNWSNMTKGQKKVSNYLKFYIRVLTDKNLLKKTVRYPKFKSYMVVKYYIPDEIYC